MQKYTAATKPTFYFIGVTTTKSSIMRVFPKWAQALGLDAQIKGIDLPIHAQPEIYREAVDFIKNDPLSLGALVTTHKLDLFTACKDMFDYIDPFAELLEEVSSLSKKDGKFQAHAKDPISSGLALEAFVPKNFWRDKGGEVLLIGAGGSSLAMTTYFTQQDFAGNYPKKITLANRSLPRLEHAKIKLANAANKTEIVYAHCPKANENDALIAALPEYSLIVNATGLGKDMPGSPTTDAVIYPKHSLVWEINYRGDLIFKAQAEAQPKENNIHVEDGWIYFIHGWTQVIEEVFQIKFTEKDIEKLSEIAINV